MTEAAALSMDERGVLCPLPIIHLARRISEVEVGELIEVLCDDPAAATDIPAWCAMRHQEMVSASPNGEAPQWTTYRVRRLR